MRKYIQRVFGILGISALLMGAASPVVLAATASSVPNSSGQALEIAPPLIYLSVNPGQTVTTQILIRDIASTPLTVTAQADDFVASGEDGTPKVLLNNDTNDPFSLRAWVQPPSSLQLVPKQIKTLPVTLVVPSNASPGGHYGVIRFTATAPSLNGTSGVSLSASIGSLMLVTVSGKISENLSVQSFTVNHAGHTGSFFQSGPVNFVEVLKNTGNIHEQPVGQVTITDMFGTKLGAVNVNLPPGNVLPDSSRKFTQALDKTVIGNKRLFGRYTAKLSVSYGTPKKVLTASLAFWVIPYKLIAILILLLLAVFFVLRYFIRRYNRRILEQAQKSQSHRSQQPKQDK